MVKSGSYEAGRGCDITRDTQESATVSERGEFYIVQLLRGSHAGEKVYVVVKIGHLPLESRRIGQYPEFIFIKDGFPVDDLENYLPSGRIGKAPVYCGGLRDNTNNVNFPDGFFYFIDVFATAKYPWHELQVGDCVRFLGGIVFLVFPVIGKVEQPGRKSGFVKTL